MTNAERQRKFVAEQRKKGLVRKQVWTLPKYWDRIKAYVVKLNKGE